MPSSTRSDHKEDVRKQRPRAARASKQKALGPSSALQATKAEDSVYSTDDVETSPKKRSRKSDPERCTRRAAVEAKSRITETYREAVHEPVPSSNSKHNLLKQSDHSRQKKVTFVEDLEAFFGAGMFHDTSPALLRSSKATTKTTSIDGLSHQISLTMEYQHAVIRVLKAEAKLRLREKDEELADKNQQLKVKDDEIKMLKDEVLALTEKSRLAVQKYHRDIRRASKANKTLGKQLDKLVSKKG